MNKNELQNLLIQYYKEKLSSDRSWAERAILTLYDYQTQTEQTSKETHEDNGVGFTGADAKILSKCATWIKEGRHLNDWYLMKAYKLLPKYARQLIKISNPKTVESILNQLKNQN